MNNKQILKKAIEKAVKNGFVYPIETSTSTSNSIEDTCEYGFECYAAIIFSHDFAKAIWGEEDMWHKTKCNCGGAGIHLTDDEHYLKCAKLKSKRGYEYHLQQMVLEKEPLKYIEKFL